jgi:MFS family permease
MFNEGPYAAMTATLPPAGERHRRLAFWLVAYAFAVTMLGTTLPTPLYSIYQARLEFSELMVTVIYSTYAVGVIAALLAFGSWSDQVGRRRVLLGGVALSAASAVVFLVAGGLPALFIGRVLSGLSAGIFTGAGTVAVIELAPERQRRRATFVATAANMGGLGCGPLLAGLLAQYAPLPLQLCFIVDLVLLAVAAFGIWFAPETVAIPANPQLQMQRLSLPEPVRAAFVPAAISSFAAFAVFGFFTAVAPAVLGHLLKQHNHALTGAVVFALFLASPLGQFVLNWVARERALTTGCIILIVGVGFVAGAIAIASLVMLLLGAVVTGFGQGMVFRAGLADITAVIPEGQRAEVTSTFFVILYVAISIPVVGVGVTGEFLGLRIAGMGFAIGVAILIMVALLILLRRTDK